MKRNEHLDHLSARGYPDPAAYHDVAFSRNIGLLSPGEQERLAGARVAIPGMGGVGGVHLLNLVRTGIGNFNLADFDVFEAANVNRQAGAKVPAFGRPKLEVMIGEALAINPFLSIDPFSDGLTMDNMARFLSGVDAVLDGLDFFQFEIRRTLFNMARSMGIPVITAGPLGFSSALLVFTADGMSFDEYFDVRDSLSMEEKYLHFAMGLAPRPTQIGYMDLSRVDLRGGKGPSLSIACQLCAALAATEAVRVILGRPGLKPAPSFLQVDPYLRTLRQGRLPWGNRSPLQRLKIWYVRNVLLAAAAKARPEVPPMPAAVGTPSAVPSREMADYLLRAAVRAPSGDNVQPWRFRRTDNAIQVFMDSDADRSFFNIRQTASVIACGAALENISLAAASAGLRAAVTIRPDATQENLMAEARFEPGAPGPSPLARCIWTRCTNRRPYSRRPLPAWLQDDLKARLTDMPGADLHLLTTRSQLRRLARVVYLADRIRTEHRGLHEHFVSMVRFSAYDAQRTRDGLPLPNLEAGRAGDVFLRLTRPWQAMRIANALRLGRLAALHSGRGILASGAAGLVVVDGLEERDFLLGGQALQRIWLALDHHGLQMQPMTAVTLFWLRWLWEGADAFAGAHRSMLEAVWDELQALFTGVNFNRQGPVMLFRTGYGPGIRHRTLRKGVDTFLMP
ncbi:ThiF family adenylyltransferase [Desulfomicrobium salsuginis]